MVTAVSTSALAALVIGAIVAPTTVADWVNTGFTKSAEWFGLYWQGLLLITFVVAVAIAFTPWARARLGGTTQPEYGRFKWIAMIMCTLLAGGGVFWAAAEPMYHFTNTPPNTAGPVAAPRMCGQRTLTCQRDGRANVASRALADSRRSTPIAAPNGTIALSERLPAR